MPFLLATTPKIECYVRGEYLKNLEPLDDEDVAFAPATVAALMSVRSDSLWFQVVLKEPWGGYPFLVPIEALVTRPDVARAETRLVQPWDCFSKEIGVTEIELVRRTPVSIWPDQVLGIYLFTVASTGSDIADDPGQRKLLHVVARDDGLIGAYPNNRLRFIDRALFGDATKAPRFRTLAHEFRAERADHDKAKALNGHAEHALRQ